MEASVMTGKAISDEHKFPHAFIASVFSQDWTAAQHIKALYGWLMREHAEAKHPDTVGTVEEMATAGMDPDLMPAWLYGYRFRDTAAPGGSGVGDKGSSGS
jgi:hypothetical protein